MLLARCFLLVLLLGLTGCVGSRPVSTHPPETLTEVNLLLAGREARVVLDDGSSVTGEGIAVFSDSVRFATGQPALPTSRVRRITYERDRLSVGKTAGVGFLAGVVAAGLIAADLNGPVVGFAILSPLFGMGGAVAGVAVGLLDEVGEQEREAYEGPITRYGPSVRE